MAIIGEWFRRLDYLLRRRTVEDELRREMEAHRALMKNPEAFGNTLHLREEARDAWGWTWLDDLLQDTRFALRALRRTPGVTLTAVVTLALGIGANIGMFSLVNGLLLRPLYERPDEVVAVSSRSTTPGEAYRGVSYANYVDVQEGTTDIFASLAAYTTVFVGVDVGEGPRRTMASAVTANYFDTFGVPLARGRSFTAEEARPGARIRVAIVSHSLWQQRGADPNILGQQMQISGEPFTVIGVASPGFMGTGIPGPDVWFPFGAQGRQSGARDAHELTVVGRLRAGTSRETAAPALATVARRLEREFPAINFGYTLEVSAPSRLAFMPGGGAIMATLASLLMLMPAIVLLVACLNLVDLLLARGQNRRQEMAIRSSLGGSRTRLARQLMTEALLLAFAGAAVGFLLSKWATSALLASLRTVLPVALTLPALGIDWRVLIGTAVFSVVATLIFGAWPAWRLTGRAGASELMRRVRDDGSRRAGGGKIDNTLVIGQVALSVLLLASGGLFVMSALSVATADPGFRLDGGLLVEVDPGLAGYDEARGRQSLLRVVDRLRSVPGVEAVSIGSAFPFSGMSDSRDVAPFGVANTRAYSDGAVFIAVGRDYARVLGLPMLAGRDFSDAEVAGSAERVAIIDDVLAHRLWPGENALGRLVQFLEEKGPEAKQPIRIVGIVPAVNHSPSDARPSAHVYVPLGQYDESGMTLQLRIADRGAERAMLATVARVIREVDPRLPVLRVQTWRDHLNAGLDVWLYRAGARVFSAFGGIALLLAVIGIYGVKSYVVSRRTREFGIRIAVGAHPRAVLWQVLREGGRVTAVGIGIGVLLALGAGQLLQGFLYGVNAVEPVVLVTAPLILLAASLAASYVPALRATKVDPTVALRSE
jgi:predicted permease